MGSNSESADSVANCVNPHCDSDSPPRVSARDFSVLQTENLNEVLACDLPSAVVVSSDTCSVQARTDVSVGDAVENVSFNFGTEPKSKTYKIASEKACSVSSKSSTTRRITEVKIKKARLWKLEQEHKLKLEILRAKADLAEAEIMAEAELQDVDQNLGELEQKTMTPQERVVNFLDSKDAVAQMSRSPVAHSGSHLRPDAPVWAQPQVSTSTVSAGGIQGRQSAAVYSEHQPPTSCVQASWDPSVLYRSKFQLPTVEYGPAVCDSGTLCSATSRPMNLWHGPAVDGYRRPCDVATAPRVNHDGANQLPNTDKSVDSKMTVDDLAKILIRCRDVPTPSLEDRFDGDPKLYYRFMYQVEDRILRVYAESDPGHALHLLAAATRGRARRIIDNCMLNPSPRDALSCALQDLKAAFGSPQRTVSALLQQVRNGPVVRATADGLEDLYIDMMACRQGMLAAGAYDELNAYATTEAIFWRLPMDLRKQFVRFTVDHSSPSGRVRFDDVLLFVDQCKKEASSTFGRLLHEPRSTESSYPRSGGSRYTKAKFTRTQALRRTDLASKEMSPQDAKVNVQSRDPKSKLCDCGKPSEHALWKCNKFVALSVEDRIADTKLQRRCFNCLSEGHFIRDCKSNRRCQKCNGAHHTLLHRFDNSEKISTAETLNKRDETDAAVASVVGAEPTCNRAAHANTARSARGRTRLKVLPVRVTNMRSGLGRDVLALLDDGSDTHLISKSLYDELSLVGTPIRSHLCMANGEHRTSDTFETQIEIRGLNETASFTLKGVQVVDRLSDLRSSIPSASDFENYPHLSDVDIPLIDRTTVDLLIGLNYRILHELIERRDAGEEKLCAGRTVLGWFLYGNDCYSQSSPEENVVCQIVGLDDRSDADLLKLAVVSPANKGQCPTCNGTGGPTPDVEFDYRAPSVNDDRATAIMDSSCNIIDGHYQIALPWVSNKPGLPNNRPIALSRLSSLGRRLKSNPNILAKYTQKINEMIEHGYAALVDPDVQQGEEGKVWYIPHHNTKGEKFRIVFDASCCYKGVTLNERLLQGPNNTNLLLGVLLRFRLHEYAVVADIKSMFHQVRVDPSDRSALRILYWRDGDPDEVVNTYEMSVHAFGLTSSPSVAGYALRRTVVDNQSKFSVETCNTVNRNFYVDDLLKGVATSEGLVALIDELDKLLTCGGFKLMKFSSNHPELLNGVASERLLPRYAELDLRFEDIPEQKTLGVCWSPSSDCFHISAASCDYVLTRRGLLSFLCRWYDPLGIVSPFLLPAKLILQSFSRSNLGWDDSNLPYVEKMRWLKWKKGLRNLDGIKLPRRFAGLTDAEYIQLHCFTDASKHAFGFVFYMLTCNKGHFALSFVMGRSRVLPAECTTTPRAELHAAYEAVKTSSVLIREIGCKFDSVVFWCDSQTVLLGYVKNPDKRLPVFEANRVKRILQVTNSTQWRWVDTKRNPADLFSRGLKLSCAKRAREWLEGPPFLLQGEEGSSMATRTLSVDTEGNSVPDNVGEFSECAYANVNVAEITVSKDILSEKLIAHYSTLPRLVRAAAWWLRLKRKLRNRILKNCTPSVVVSGPISANEYAEALRALICVAQRTALPGVADALECGDIKVCDTYIKGVCRPLLAYCPYVEEGLIRIGGRLHRSDLSYDFKHPIVLPRRHALTGLIIMDLHCKIGHFASGFVMNELTKNYFVLGGKRTVKHYIRLLCMNCRNRDAAPGAQLMAPLPLARIESRNRPFTNTAVDYFGPILVRQGRNNLKRYGCIFLCLATRAIHLEVAEDLSAESFLMAYRRFLSVTGGATRVLYSDNGTNFVGAHAELKRGLARLDKRLMTAAMAQNGVDWKLNPPLASHQGGVWESMIRLVRKTMSALQEDKKLRTLTEKGLETLFREVQLILNSRPITRVSADPNDLRALSPLSILTGCVDPVLPTDVFVASDSMRSSWRASQRHADEFWRRWSEEYLPLLQRRAKWLQSQRNIKIGDHVLVGSNDAKPRCAYDRAIAINVSPDKFGHVRRVTVRDASGKTYERDIRKLCWLEGDINDHADQ